MSAFSSEVLVRPARRLAALLRSCHPEPAVAVTVLLTALAVAAGRGPAGSAAVAAAVLAGQLSVGWCNDAADAERDRAAGRRDKPVAGGEISSRTVAVAARTALVLCVPLSLLSGALAGTVHVMAVLAGGWAYNLWFKRTVLSPLPYALAFGAVPAFITLGLPSHPWPAWWVMTAGALLGVGAHLVNVLPDIEDDLAAGVRGLPQRLGRTACRWLAPFVMLTAVGVLVAGPPGPVDALSGTLAGAAAIIAIAGTALPSGARGRRPFRAAIAVAGLAVMLLLLRGSDLA
ncbi:4-hydroxybenzoate polyprenyltransferase [Thermomonospora echinospora]|uniref:4-hydroxybenzoate polyprenyltransferase n=1 Tax=Thermomonospora echinospora TaxID=1992 RepID=A0A1H6CZ75_9ACTN|nr:UbiA family prenyltransferase [Thermomonospora echinospora]SEG78312.1 4-hydroxybenzoate polyprenyltransferase [Thermomonospora echinospora]